MWRVVSLGLFALLGCRADEETWEKLLSELDQDGDGSRSDVDDCDDEDAAISPDAEEICDGIDNDCDGQVDEELSSTWYADTDADGYGDATTPTTGCTQPAGTVVDATDCDDADAAIHPDAAETDCTDPVDYNCDGSSGYADADGDGVPACLDCADDVASTFPGALETCNDVDDDCDAEVDEDAQDEATWYADGDADGYGGEDTTTACDAPEGYVAAAGDCDDADAAYNPGADESDCADPNDYNCDGSVGYADADGDGFAACSECDDTNAATNPAATELCNDVDDDCDGEIDVDAVDAPTWYLDTDGDGFGDADAPVVSCDAPAGAVADASDCDDAAAGTYPGASEVCDDVDDDCDGSVDEAGASGEGTWYLDEDGDGHGGGTAVTACDAPTGATTTSTDCDDGDATISPSGVEACNGVDDDCDGSVDEPGATGEGTWYTDADGDGFGGPSAVTACDAPAGATSTSTDCDDGDAAISPAGVEACNGLDDDCDGSVDEAGATGETTWYVDADGDGFGAASPTMTSCSSPAGYVDNDEDCEDASSAISPAGTEVCDAADNDCSGAADDGGVCPCDVETYGGDPYMFCDSTASRADALTTCEYYGYDLVSIADSAEDVWVVDEAYSRYVGKWWTGLDDSAVEGTWAWGNGDAVTYTNWASGEPNDSGGNEDCMQLGRFSDYTWNDEPCTSSFRFVCEG